MLGQRHHLHGNGPSADYRQPVSHARGGGAGGEARQTDKSERGEQPQWTCIVGTSPGRGVSLPENINHSHANDILTREVLTLNLSHRVRPSQGDYAYIVLPGVKDIKSLRRYSKSNPIEIVANEPTRQLHKATDLLEESSHA